MAWLKRSVSWLVLILGAVIVVAGIAFAFLLFKMGDAMGSKPAVHYVVSAPDGRVSAIEFEMEGGATVGFDTQLSLMPAGGSFSPDDYPPVLVLSGEHDLVLHWNGSHELDVVLPRGERVYRKETGAEGVTVVYE